MFYLISWKEKKVVFTADTEQKCRDERERLKGNHWYDDYELVIAQSIE